MGTFTVKGFLTGPNGPQGRVEFLVDTGSTLLVIPQPLAERLELISRRPQPVVMAGGQREFWPVSEVRLTLDGQEIPTPCFIGPADQPLLGAVPLESLFLAVDPIRKRLIPVKGFVGCGRTVISSNMQVP